MKPELLASFTKKKTRTLLVPYALACLAIILIAGIAACFTGNNALTVMGNWLYASVYGAGDSYSEHFRIKAIGAVWFLWAAFWGNLLLQPSVQKLHQASFAVHGFRLQSPPLYAQARLRLF